MDTPQTSGRCARAPPLAGPPGVRYHTGGSTARRPYPLATPANALSTPPSTASAATTDRPRRPTGALAGLVTPRGGTVALVVLITLFHLATLSEGPGTRSGDDYALYVLHARNLVEGRPYDATGYVYNPLNPWLSPRTYPPGFPLLLTPLYAAFGVDFFAMKVLVVLSFAGALLLLARIASRYLPPAGVGTVVALVGLHPYLWAFRDELLPDLPFLFFALLSVLLVERAADPDAPPRRRLAWGAAAGACVAFSVSIRAIGVVLVPTVVVALLIRARRPWRAALLAGGLATVLLVGLFLLLPRDSGYLRQVRDLAAVYGPSYLVPEPDRARRVAYSVSELWSNGYSSAVAKAVAVATMLLAAAGLATRARRPAAPEIFFAGYLCAVFLWPAVLTRYLVPIVPLYLLYAVLGAGWVARRGRTAGRGAVGVVALAVAATYVARYSDLIPGPVRAGASNPYAEALYRHVRTSTAPDARFVAPHPRALALFTGRAASPPPRRVDDRAYLEYLRSARIGYVVVPLAPGAAGPFQVVQRVPQRFQVVYANDRFRLLRVLPGEPR